MNLNNEKVVYMIITKIQLWFSVQWLIGNHDIGIYYVHHFQAMLARGVCELAHSFFHLVFTRIEKSTGMNICLKSVCVVMWCVKV